MVLQLLRSRLLESFAEVDQLNPASKKKHAKKTSKHGATFSFHPKRLAICFFCMKKKLIYLSSLYSVLSFPHVFSCCRLRISPGLPWIWRAWFSSTNLLRSRMSVPTFAGKGCVAGLTKSDQILGVCVKVLHIRRNDMHVFTDKGILQIFSRFAAHGLRTSPARLPLCSQLSGHLLDTSQTFRKIKLLHTARLVTSDTWTN